MKTNVVVTLINPITRQISTKEYFDISAEEANRIWNVFLQGSKGASTSNLGYEPENYPEYSTSAGFISSIGINEVESVLNQMKSKTNVKENLKEDFVELYGFLYTWVQWKSK